MYFIQYTDENIDNIYATFFDLFLNNYYLIYILNLKSDKIIIYYIYIIYASFKIDGIKYESYYSIR